MNDAATESLPRVSVITPFLNGNEFMDDAVSSVIAQTYRSWELLLVDDGSTDGSSEKAKRYADLLPGQIRYFEHAGHANFGQGLSRNLAIRYSCGEYVAFLDVDDVWLPDKLQNQVDALLAHPEAAMTYGPYFFWHGWTGRIEDIARDLQCDVGTGREYNTVVLPPVMLVRHIEHGNGLPIPCSAMVRRAPLEAVGGFETEFSGMYDDEALFAKLTVRYPVYINSGCWDRYRQHAGSFCARAIRDGKWDSSPKAPSPERVRFLRWLMRYVQRRTAHQDPRLLDAIRRKINELGVTYANGGV